MKQKEWHEDEGSNVMATQPRRDLWQLLELQVTWTYDAVIHQIWFQKKKDNNKDSIA